MAEQKVALVTGAARGIGRAIALALAQDYAVVVGDLDAEGLTQLVAEIEQQNGKAAAVKANVTVAEDIEALVQTAVERFGRLDVLVNNAGITRDSLLLRMDDSAWDAVIDINLKGAFRCTRAAAKVMTKQRYGRIINIASIVGQMGNAGQANYCASKGGIIAMTKSNARELAKRNVTVNAVAPGFIETDMTAALPEKVRQDLTRQIPMERLGAAEDIAAAVVFLASDAAAYITGQVLGVNGGMYM